MQCSSSVEAGQSIRQLVEQCPFQPVNGTAVADHLGRYANHCPAIERRFIVLFAIFLKAFGVGVPFAVAGFCFHPDSALNFTGNERLFPAKIKAPLAMGMEGVLLLWLWQFCQTDQIQEHVVPVDMAAPIALLLYGFALHKINYSTNVLFLKMLLETFVENDYQME